MEDFFFHPAVQGGIAPFAVALAVVLLLGRWRLAGLAAVAAFFTAYGLVGGFTLFPLTATRKIALLALAAPIVGLLLDFAFRPTRIGAVVLALAAAAGAAWTFWPVLSQRNPAEIALLGGSALATTAWLVGFSQLALAEQPLRAGACGLALGLGAGAAAILGASISYGVYASALGAASGAFLLPQMITGKKWHGGATFMLSVSYTAALVASGAAVLASLRWYVVPVFALVPLATRLAIPQRAPIWLQAVLLSLYGFIASGAAVWLAWASAGAASD